LLVLIGLSLFFMIIDSTGRSGNLFNFLTDPIAALLSWTAARTDAFAVVLSGPGDLQAAQGEIGALQAKLASLQADNERLRRIEEQYLRLQALLDAPDITAIDPNLLDETERRLLALREVLATAVSESAELTRTAATVIGRGVNPYSRDVIIDKGSDDGVRAGMPVETSLGLIGQVYRTTPNSAQVILLSDGLSKIPARLGTSRATGVLLGGGPGDVLTLDWIDLEAQITVGDKVITSGLAGDTPQEQVANRFPPNILIGRIIEVQRQEAALFQRALIKPQVDLNAIETVFVITDFKPIDTHIFEEATPAP
jgi:rod shape-determining protein MreC